MTKLTPHQIETALARLPGWSLVKGKLHRDYVFPDFNHAFAFMAGAASAAQRLNHHPDWSNVYNKVTVDLITHDAAAVTSKDVDLARIMESIALKLQ